MIPKDKLAQQLSALIDLKKSLIPLLDKHISSSLYFSQLQEQDRETILERLRYLAKVQAKHIDLLGSMSNDIMHGAFDVY